jgi:hypothetical protein
MSKLAQSDDQMFERNLAIMSSRKKEIRLFSDGFIYEGFLCGLDEKWIQIYGHEELDREVPEVKWRFMLINRDNVSAIGPTGRDLDDYDSETRSWINDKISVFVGRSSEFNAVRSTNRGKRENV